MAKKKTLGIPVRNTERVLFNMDSRMADNYNTADSRTHHIHKDSN